jgi:hypothetical protein
VFGFACHTLQLETVRVLDEFALADTTRHVHIHAIVSQNAIETVALASDQRTQLRFQNVETLMHVLGLFRQQPLGVRRKEEVNQ